MQVIQTVYASNTNSKTLICIHLTRRPNGKYFVEKIYTHITLVIYNSYNAYNVIYNSCNFIIVHYRVLDLEHSEFESLNQIPDLQEI